jgi:short subunit dehydrogenase-like uncharacterized protein
MSQKEWLIYGATGYTGKLIAHMAAAKGLKPILAGRDKTKIQPLADSLSLPWRAFTLSDAAGTDAGLKGASVVLHCAGPFSKTYKPMVAACLRNGVHYLDITGEIEVFEGVFRRHEAAKKAGSVLIPGVGFDVIPTDCLAANLAAKMPDALHLDLAFATSGKTSPGTMKTAVDNLERGNFIRRDGVIKEVPTGKLTTEAAFSHRKLRVVAIPWGDISTAYHTTQIPNITTYTSLPEKMMKVMRWTRFFKPVLRLEVVKNYMRQRIEKNVKGPTDDERRRSRVYLWGRVENSQGKVLQGTFDVPDGYEFTMIGALACVERLLAMDQPRGGSYTPSEFFGKDLAESLPGVSKIRYF